MLTLCPNFIKFMLKFSCFSLHLDLRDWKHFRDSSSEHLRQCSEVAVTFSEIPVVTRRKNLTHLTGIGL